MEGKNKGGISDKELSELKKKNPGLKCGSIENLARTKGKGKIGELNEEDKLFFYFVKPDASVFSLSVAHLQDKDAKAAQMCFYSNCSKWTQPGIADGPYADEHTYSVGRFIGSTFQIADGQEEDF